jgi:hypothetical protein
MCNAAKNELIFLVLKTADTSSDCNQTDIYLRLTEKIHSEGSAFFSMISGLFGQRLSRVENMHLPASDSAVSYRDTKVSARSAALPAASG